MLTLDFISNSIVKLTEIKKEEEEEKENKHTFKTKSIECLFFLLGITKKIHATNMYSVLP